jgi:hypothetical protein
MVYNLNQLAMQWLLVLTLVLSWKQCELIGLCRMILNFNSLAQIGSYFYLIDYMRENAMLSVRYIVSCRTRCI